mmetsp:Transcript_21283/g.46994  ORF Transcript_21283/g.46994 Transcript_21283/m.46994 type:complete len:201 (+) Transcript_21283:313-915(+)
MWAATSQFPQEVSRATFAISSVIPKVLQSNATLPLRAPIRSWPAPRLGLGPSPTARCGARGPAGRGPGAAGAGGSPEPPLPFAVRRPRLAEESASLLLSIPLAVSAEMERAPSAERLTNAGRRQMGQRVCSRSHLAQFSRHSAWKMCEHLGRGRTLSPVRNSSRQTEQKLQSGAISRGAGGLMPSHGSAVALGSCPSGGT